VCREKCHKKQLLKFASNNKLVLLGRKTSHCGGALKAEISSKISNFGDLRFFFKFEKSAIFTDSFIQT